MGNLGNPLLGVLQAADGQDWTEVFTSCKENPTEGLVMFLVLDLALLHWTAQGPAGVSLLLLIPPAGTAAPAVLSELSLRK